MSDVFFSASWYRVANLRPKLRDQVSLFRHHYRGQRWYVLREPASGRSHLLSPSAHWLIGFLDGERTLDQAWKIVVDELGDDAPTQDETIRLMGLLHFANALVCDVTPDTEELLSRSRRREHGERWQRLMNPLSIRVPLWDPDAFLSRMAPHTTWLFGRFGLITWLTTVLVASVLAVGYFAELTAASSAEILDPKNLALLVFAYPVMKALHELAHGLAAKTFGCSVRETGVIFLAFIPVPYVDASDSNALPEKGRRIAVAAAGIMAESWISAVALFVWLAAEPGWVRDLAYNITWMGAISTLLFNGNPLLRFDAYYVLADAIEIPNLAARSGQYVRYIIEHHIFGLARVRNPVSDPGQAPWFLVYGILAGIYRFVIVFSIALFVATRFFMAGIFLAIFSVITQVLLPMAKNLAELFTHQRFASKRPRVLGIALGSLAILLLSVTTAPVSLSTRAEGVVLPPEDSQIRAGADGFVVEFLAETDQEVVKGQPLLRTRDPLLEAEVAVLEAKLRELTAQRHAERQDNLVRAQVTDEEVLTTRIELERTRERSQEFQIVAPAKGRFVLVEHGDLKDRFVERGTLLGYVLADSRPVVRVVVDEGDAALIRTGSQSVEVRRSSDFASPHEAVLVREVPAASNRLPSPVLGPEGGGGWPVVASDESGVESATPVFQFDIEPGGWNALPWVGERIYVQFDHGGEPIAKRFLRAGRRLFLSRFGV